LLTGASGGWDRVWPGRRVATWLAPVKAASLVPSLFHQMTWALLVLSWLMTSEAQCRKGRRTR
jgi:hypothetical protein